MLSAKASADFPHAAQSLTEAVKQRNKMKRLQNSPPELLAIDDANWGKWHAEDSQGLSSASHTGVTETPDEIRGAPGDIEESPDLMATFADFR